MSLNMQNPDRNDNRVQVVGKLVDIAFREGKSPKNGADYISYTGHVRVSQMISGVMTTSEIKIQDFANKYTSQGAPNKKYAAINNMRSFKTIADYGIDDASIIRCNMGTLQDSSYVSSKTKQYVKAWQLNTPFVELGSVNDVEVAQFTGYVFIMDMLDEEDSNGELTGRMIVKGAIARYGGKIGMVEFVAEDPNQIEWLRNNWNPKTTVALRASVRVAEKSTEAPVVEDEGSGWGGDFSMGGSAPRTIPELVIAKAKPSMDEELGYDPTAMRNAYNIYKADRDQAIANAAAPKKTVSTAAASWE